MTSIFTRATVHGAVSIVNAIATGKGSALGISLKTTAEIHMQKGEGRIFYKNRKSELLNNIIHRSIPKDLLKQNDIRLSISSDIPIGFGLKSSSAVSCAISLACYGLLDSDLNDFKVLETAVNASRQAKITITGAYDDSTACYFGGFVITDNHLDKLIRRKNGPDDLQSLILLPNNSERKNPFKLKNLAELFDKAFQMAENSDYWNAMNLNGVLVSSLMGYDYSPILLSIENGALSASISGNGPSIAVITEEKNLYTIRNILEKYGKILVCNINNTQARVEKIVG
jgi:shikimate kinase